MVIIDKFYHTHIQRKHHMFQLEHEFINKHLQLVVANMPQPCMPYNYGFILLSLVYIGNSIDSTNFTLVSYYLKIFIDFHIFIPNKMWFPNVVSCDTYNKFFFIADP